MKEKGYLCYMYQNEYGYHYLRLDNLDDLTDTIKGRSTLYKNKVNSHAVPGAIVEHEFKGEAVIHSHGPIIATWGTPADVMMWKETQRQYKAEKQKLQVLERLDVKNACTLLNIVYHKLGYANRSAFIYKVIEEITKR